MGLKGIIETRLNRFDTTLRSAGYLLIPSQLMVTPLVAAPEPTKRLQSFR